MDSAKIWRNIVTLLVKKKFAAILDLKWIFVTLLFFAGCQQRASTNLTLEERQQLEPLFNYVFFQNPGVFVLFGSKPMSECSLPPLDSMSKEEAQKAFESMPESLRAQACLVECHLNEQWEVWKTVSKRLPLSSKYLLIEKNHGQGRILFFVHVVKCQEVIAAHYPYFKELLGNDFSVPTAVLEIQNERSEFWNKALTDHKAMGLLFGFGEENIALFDCPSSECCFASKSDPFSQASAKEFPIPTFLTTPNHPMIHQYESEREQIRKLYNEQDMLEISLNGLCDSAVLDR